MHISILHMNGCTAMQWILTPDQFSHFSSKYFKLVLQYWTILLLTISSPQFHHTKLVRFILDLVTLRPRLHSGCYNPGPSCY